MFSRPSFVHTARVPSSVALAPHPSFLGSRSSQTVLAQSLQSWLTSVQDVSVKVDGFHLRLGSDCSPVVKAPHPDALTWISKDSGSLVWLNPRRLTIQSRCCFTEGAEAQHKWHIRHMDFKDERIEVHSALAYAARGTAHVDHSGESISTQLPSRRVLQTSWDSCKTARERGQLLSQLHEHGGWTRGQLYAALGESRVQPMDFPELIQAVKSCRNPITMSYLSPSLAWVWRSPCLWSEGGRSLSACWRQTWIKIKPNARVQCWRIPGVDGNSSAVEVTHSEQPWSLGMSC